MPVLLFEWAGDRPLPRILATRHEDLCPFDLEIGMHRCGESACLSSAFSYRFGFRIRIAKIPTEFLMSPFKSTILTLLGWLIASLAGAADRPNIVWIIIDDMSANLSCYGEETIETPHLDALADSGLRFSKAFVTAPVCSTNRSAFITGMYQTTIGSHHHRSGRGN